MKKIALIGSEELSRRIMYYVESTGFGQIVGMFDDFEEAGVYKYGRPVLGPISTASDLFRQNQFDSTLIGVGYRNRRFRKEVYESLQQADVPIDSFVHPTAHIEPSARIHEGVIIIVNCTVDMNAEIGENVFISSNCFISHDVMIKAHTFCGPSVNLAGHTEVGECCFLGINTTTVDGICLGKNVQTAAGAVVTRDIPENVLVAGIPAKTIKAIPF